MTTLRRSAAELARAELRRRVARAELGRRSFADFVQLAIAAGVVDGIKRVQWGPHLDAICFATQMQLEGWLVANGPDRASEAWPAWDRRHAAMIARQREAWERTGATWEDGEPEPWLRYVLVQNELDNLPPGTLKSTIVMVCANAWIWLWAPTFSFGAASGIDSNVDRDSKAARDLVKSAWYRETFAIAWRDVDDESDAIKVRTDTDAISDWATTAGGKRRSRTINTGFTGTHVDGAFIDDPDDADKVWNEADRLRPQNRYTRAIENRVNDDHRSIRKVMQQVVHPEGFSAYLLSVSRWSPTNPKGWAWLCIPAEYGHGPPDAPTETPYGWRDWRQERGEIIHPRLSPGVLADYRLKMPGYEAQYNQNAKRLGAGWFDRKHARFFLLDTDRPPARGRPEGAPKRADAPPVIVRLADLQHLTLSVDAANSLEPKPGTKRSAVGLGVVGHRGEERFVLDDRTRVLGPSETYWAIYDLMHAWPLERVLVELKALGAGAIDELRRAIRRGWYVGRNEEQVRLLGPDGEPVRCTVEPFNPGKDSKEQRAHGTLLPAWQQGLVLLRDGADWIYPTTDESRKTIDEGLFEEVCSYPASRRNDRIDWLSQLIADGRRRPIEAPTVFGAMILS